MNTKTSHFFLRNHGGHRIGVVALRYVAVANTSAYVTVAVSLCHDNDAWNSTTGVAAARGRLASRNAKGMECVTYRVDDDVAIDDVFHLLKPSGILKKRDDVDWGRMQALFERQWKYLTTPKAPAQGEG